MFNLLLIVTKEDSEKTRCHLATAGGSGIAKIVGEIIDDDGHVMRCDRYGSEPVRPVEVIPESEVSE